MSNGAKPYWDMRFTEGTDHHSNQNKEISTDFLKKITASFDLLIKNSNDVLEIGCGTGELSRLLSDKYNKKVLGTDLSTKGVEFANNHYANNMVSYKAIDILSEEADHKYDMGISSNTAEHFRNPYLFIDNILKFCNTLILLVPFNQPVRDGYDHEGGMGHVFHFTLESFAKYSIVDHFTFSTNGWQHSSDGEAPLQLAIAIKTK